MHIPLFIFINPFRAGYQHLGPFKFFVAHSGPVDINLHNLPNPTPFSFLPSTDLLSSSSLSVGSEPPSLSLSCFCFGSSRGGLFHQTLPMRSRQCILSFRARIEKSTFFFLFSFFDILNKVWTNRSFLYFFLLPSVQVCRRYWIFLCGAFFWMTRLVFGPWSPPPFFWIRNEAHCFTNNSSPRVSRTFFNRPFRFAFFEDFGYDFSSPSPHPRTSIRRFVHPSVPFLLILAFFPRGFSRAGDCLRFSGSQRVCLILFCSTGSSPTNNSLVGVGL